MRASGKCTKCGSTEIVPGVRMIDQSQGQELDQRLRVDRDPDALLFKEPLYSEVRGWVCGRCGYCELYAVDPGELLTAWREAQEAETP